jgi:hypothetical protein
MFIYALTRTVAEANGYEWGFNPFPEFDYHQGKPQMAFMEIDYGIENNYSYYDLPESSEGFKNVRHELYNEYVFENGKTGRNYYYDPSLFSIPDYTKLYIDCGQDARYYDKEKLKQWFRIKEENKGVYMATLREWGVDISSENTCVINIRGGEYKGISELILPYAYWQNAIYLTLNRNPKMRFIAISDDIQYANQVLDFKIPVAHMSIGGDYYIINKAKNLILSNSSFAILPTWLNENNPFVIAPRYWARYNVSNKYWISSDIWTFGWKFLGRDGKLYDR